LTVRDGSSPRIGSVCTSPLMASSRDTAPFGPGLPPSITPWGMRRNRMLSAGARALVLRRVQRIADAAVREVVGRDAGSFVLDWPLLADDIFVLTAPSFEYPRRDLDDRLDYVGPVLDTAGRSHATPKWWHLLDGADPVVVVTQGTLDNGDMGRLIEPTLTALAHTPTLVIATTGGPSAEAVRAPGDNSVVAEFVPFDMLLPRADVLVTNGGWGGVHFALRHGVPIVVAGSTEDKNEVAARIVRSGTGIRLRSTRPAAIRRAVQTVLDDPGYRHRAGALARELAALDGARGISEALNRPPKHHWGTTAPCPPR
jgi:UDP:flavonoid glycosyltransferase YjiC (YdhE family)